MADTGSALGTTPLTADELTAARWTRSLRSWSSRACRSGPVVRVPAVTLRRGGPVT